MDTLAAPPGPLSPSLCFLYRKSVVAYYLSDDPQGPSGARRLPSIPGSIIDYLAIACDRFWVRHQRCMGVILVFTPRTRLWTWHLPRQHCGPYSTDACDEGQHFVPPPGTYIAGSLQAFAHKSDSNIHRMPTYPGLHFVCIAPEFKQTLSVLLSCDPQQRRCRELSLDTVILDDQRLMLESAMTRLVLLD
jgi:hypothetical protein